MNGRIYDPLLGRMLSADIVVQFPGDLQSYNRYSYVENNPLTKVDPAGFQSRPAAQSNVLAEMQSGLQARYQSSLNRAHEALVAGDRFEYTRIMDREVRPRGRQLGINYPGDSNFRGRGPSYTELRDANKPMTLRDRLAFEQRAAEHQSRLSAQQSQGSGANRNEPRSNQTAPVAEEPKIEFRIPSNGQPATPIQGNAQRTSPGHAETSQQIANEMAGSGQYRSVHLNQALSTITQGEVKDARRPDVAGVTNSGTVTVVEIPSRTQSPASQQTKVDSVVFTLGPLAAPDSRVEPIRQPPPPPPPKDPLKIEFRIP